MENAINATLIPSTTKDLEQTSAFPNAQMELSSMTAVPANNAQMAANHVKVKTYAMYAMPMQLLKKVSAHANLTTRLRPDQLSTMFKLISTTLNGLTIKQTSPQETNSTVLTSLASTIRTSMKLILAKHSIVTEKTNQVMNKSNKESQLRLIPKKT